MKISRWLQAGHSGQLDNINDTNELLEAAGAALDRDCAHETLGSCMFVGDDGKTYVGCVEFIISEANPEYAAEVLSELDESS